MVCFGVQCTVYMYTVHCTLYIVHCTMYTVHGHISTKHMPSCVEISSGDV